LKWGAIAAAAFVAALALFAAIKGFLFGWHPGATIWGQAPPGWEAAATGAFFMTVFAALPLSPVAFVAGCIASRWWGSGKKPPPIVE
jgi:hypothetical protein